MEDFNIEDHILRCEISYRGGGVEVDVSELFGEDAKITAYQNYLGGGIAGSIQSDANFEPKAKQVKKFNQLAEDLKRWFYDQNNGGGDEYMQENVTGAEAGGYEALQRMSRSAY